MCVDAYNCLYVLFIFYVGFAKVFNTNRRYNYNEEIAFGGGTRVTGGTCSHKICKCSDFLLVNCVPTTLSGFSCLRKYQCVYIHVYINNLIIIKGLITATKIKKHGITLTAQSSFIKFNSCAFWQNFLNILRHAPATGWCRPGFKIVISVTSVYICVCVCSQGH